MSDIFWKRNPKILLSPEKLQEFVPTQDMSYNEKLNAISRFIIYFGVIVYIVTGNMDSIFLIILGLILVYFIYDYKVDIKIDVNKKQRMMEQVQNENEPSLSTTQQDIRQVEQIIRDIQSGGNKPSNPIASSSSSSFTDSMTDSLLPSGMFDKHTTQKHTLSNLDEKTKEKITKADQLEPFSEAKLASVNSVKDEFVGPNNNQRMNDEKNEFQMTGGRLDCGKCSNGGSPFSPPTCEKGVASALDANANMCQMPTKNNPFMNIQVTDYANNPNRLPACNPEIVKNDTNNMWSQNLFRNVNDVWDRNNGQLIFNTQPATTIPNDYEAYKKWLYDVPYVCKDGDMEACYRGAELQMPQMRPGKIWNDQ